MKQLYVLKLKINESIENRDDDKIKLTIESIKKAIKQVVVKLLIK